MSLEVDEALASTLHHGGRHDVAELAEDFTELSLRDVGGEVGDYQVGEALAAGGAALVLFLVDSHVDLLLGFGSDFSLVQLFNGSLGLLRLLELDVSVALALALVVGL